jgi:hypothetical protein
MGWIRKNKSTLSSNQGRDTRVISASEVHETLAVGDFCAMSGVAGCAAAQERYIVDFKMTATFSFVFTFRYWRTIAGSAE